MSDDNVVRPPGWRPTWRDPKPRREPGSRARVRTELPPLPSDADLGALALRTLVDVCQDAETQPAARVGAAKAILEHLDGRKPTDETSLEELEEKLERLKRAG